MNTKESSFYVVQTASDKEVLIEMASRMCLEDMAEQLGMSVSKTYVVCRINGVKCHRKKKQGLREFLLENKEWVAEHTLCDIAGRSGRQEVSIKVLCRKLNIPYKEQRGMKQHDITSWASYCNKGKIRTVYYNMLKRCYDANNPAYHRYGGRGITVCEEWKEDCCNFYRWARDSGYKEGMQLDRSDNNAGYSPENCRWVAPLQNSYNKSNTKKVEYKGVTKTLLEWEKVTGIPREVLADRIYKYSWDIDRAMTFPYKPRKGKTL